MQRVTWAAAAVLATAVACTDSSPGTVVNPPGPPGPPDSVGASPDAGPASGADGRSGLGPPPTGTTFVYTAHRGVSAPWFTPVGPDGPGDPLLLAPRRGAGYGMGEGNVSYPETTPDGSTVVVVFYPFAKPCCSGQGDPVLFAVPLDGSGADAPVRVATAPGLHALERAYRGGWMAWVGGDRVMAARLDGSDADEPLVVATAAPTMEVDTPRWVGASGRLSWVERSQASGNQRTLWVADLSPSSVGAAQKVTTTVGPAEYLAATLSDGRLVVAAGDDRMHVADLATGTAAPITPEGVIAGFVGATPDGEFVVAELRTTWQSTRELVMARTDGSDADDPRRLTPEPALALSTVMARDGTAVAWTADDGLGHTAAFFAPVPGHEATDDPRITPWSGLKLNVTDLRSVAGPPVGSREDGAALRYVVGDSPQEPVVLATVDEVVNHGIPWPVLSADGTQALYSANTPEGFAAWVVPLSGGDPVAVEPPWYWDLILPSGILSHEYVTEGALFEGDLDGNRRALTGWHGAEIRAPRVLGEDGAVLFACDAPAPGWYTAPLGVDTPAEAVLVAAGFEPALGSEAVVAGHLVGRAGTRLAAWPLDGSAADAGLAVSESSAGPWAADPTGGRVVWSAPDQVLAVSVGSGGPPIPILSGAGTVSHLAVLPSAGVALVAAHNSGTMQQRVVLAALDGSQAASPVIVSADLPGWFLTLASTATGSHVLSVLSIEATAVPHPDALVASTTGLGGTVATGDAYALAPPGMLPWAEPMAWEWGATGGGTLVTNPAGDRVVLSGPDGVYAARLDGAQADTPLHLGTATKPAPQRLTPDGHRLVLVEDGAIVTLAIDQAGSQQAITPTSPAPLASAMWAPDGRLVYHRGDPASWKGAGWLYVADLDAPSASETPLHAEEFRITALSAVAAAGAIVQSRRSGDHSLFLVSLDGGATASTPAAVTPVDDVTEAFVGWTASPTGCCP